VGLGLIGGSLARDLTEAGWTVRGLVHRESTARQARELGLADVVATDPAILAGCELVVLALPLDRLLAPAPDLLAALPPGAVVTDVGSVKGPVLRVWQPRHRRFVAGHPMAGATDVGVAAARAGLFRGRPWALTPVAGTDEAAIRTVRCLVDTVGAHPLMAGAEDHDRAVALISHLPVLVGAALLQAADGEPEAEVAALARRLASSGFADTTRVGGGNPELGTLMARTNRGALLHGLARYRRSLEDLEAMVREEDWPRLQASLEGSRAVRDRYVGASSPQATGSGNPRS
jgi:arogenate dehydrogenase (NADP+)